MRPAGEPAGREFPASAEVLALLAERLAARAGATVLALDVVAGVAVGVVMMDTLLDRVPRAGDSHGRCSLSD